MDTAHRACGRCGCTTPDSLTWSNTCLTSIARTATRPRSWTATWPTSKACTRPWKVGSPTSSDVVDPHTIDADYLPWLASWVGGVVEPDWEPVRKRLFVRFAARMFTRRGTPRGFSRRSAWRLTRARPRRSSTSRRAAIRFDVRVVEAFRNPVLRASSSAIPTTRRVRATPHRGAVAVDRWRLGVAAALAAVPGRAVPNARDGPEPSRRGGLGYLVEAVGAPPLPGAHPAAAAAAPDGATSFGASWP